MGDVDNWGDYVWVGVDGVSGQMTDFGGGADGLLMPRSERSWERLTALA